VAGLAALVGLLALAGCGTAGRAAEPVWSAAPSVSGAPAAGTAGPPSPGGEITLAFAGDVHFTGRTAGLLSDPATAFGPIAPVLRAADFAMVNLETAITARGAEEPKQYHFRAPATAFDAVRAAGVDAVTMANNHVLDYGQVGLADTLANAAAKRFPYVGIGHDAAEAFRPLVVTVRGVRIAILAFSQVHELEFTWAARDDRPGVAMAMDLSRVRAAVAGARRQADVVLVFNHWGQEGNSCATPEQRAFAGTLATAGADIVIGSHAHTLLGDGWLGRTYVAYGLANFVWYGDSFSVETGVLRLTLRGRTVVKNELVPAVVSGTGQPVPLTGAAAGRLRERFAGLRRCTGLAARPSGS
jgi:poly-gamma-glutamate capsule biosynthesis protein CapA/YwtB (metallophosphatase superfamily)